MTTRQTIKRFMEPVMMSRKPMLNMIAYDLITYAWIIFLIQCTQFAIQWIEKSDPKVFFQRIIIMASISIALIIIKIFWKPYVFKIFSDIRYNIDKLYLKKIIYGNNIQFEKYWTWKLIAAYSKWWWTRSELWTNFLTDWLTTLFLFWYFLYTASTKNINLFRWIFWALIIIILWFWKFWWLSYWRRAQAKENELENSRMKTRWLMSKYEIMQTANIPLELEKAKNVYKQWNWIKIHEKLRQWVWFDIPFFIACILFTLLIRISWKNVLEWYLQISDMVGIVWIWTIFIKELDNLLRRFRFLFDKWIDITKLWNIVDTLSNNQQWLEIWNPFIINNKSITLKKITFSYDSESKPILNALDCILQAKQKTALVWPSWWWKTTLIKLIAGYLQPNSGSVIIDEQDLAETNLLSYYKHIGYLTQDPSVFDGTIRENLEYGLSDINEAKQSIEKIIPLAKCERIYDLPQWVDTEIGERGIRLSGWQKQRLAIAKIMLKNPDIILLDEPTSALDSANEQAVTEALNNLFKNKTVIIIAHRLQTVKNADEIIYIDDGKVIERGTHAELLALWWEYYTMVELQSGF